MDWILFVLIQVSPTELVSRDIQTGFQSTSECAVAMGALIRDSLDTGWTLESLYVADGEQSYAVLGKDGKAATLVCQRAEGDRT